MNQDSFPQEMHSYFDLKWPSNLWELAGAVHSSTIDDFIWHMSCPFWASCPPENIFDLAPNSVLESPEQYPDHYHRILIADTSYPLTVSVFNGLPVILDGLHRLSKQVLNADTILHYRVVSNDKLLQISKKL